jgi:hypothetical protein
VRLRAKLAKTFTGVDRVVDSDFLRGVLLMSDLRQHDAYTREELLRLIQEQQDMIAHLREDLKTAIQAYRDALSRM